MRQREEKTCLVPPKLRTVGFRRAWDPQWQKEQRNTELTWGEDAWVEPGGFMTLLANLGVLLIVMRAPPWSTETKALETFSAEPGVNHGDPGITRNMAATAKRMRASALWPPGQHLGTENLLMGELALSHTRLQRHFFFFFRGRMDWGIGIDIYISSVHSLSRV